LFSPLYLAILLIVLILIAAAVIVCAAADPEGRGAKVSVGASGLLVVLLALFVADLAYALFVHFGR
jgi:hypothetical protein